MINYYYSRGSHGERKLPFSNPIANALVVFVGTLAIAASVVLGFIAVLVLGSLVLVLAAVIGIRVWWFNRKVARRAMSRNAGGDRKGRETRVRVHVIEGDYRDVSDDSSGQR